MERGKILRQMLEQFFSVTGAFRSSLFELHDPPADPPDDDVCPEEDPVLPLDDEGSVPASGSVM